MLNYMEELGVRDVVSADLPLCIRWHISARHHVKVGCAHKQRLGFEFFCFGVIKPIEKTLIAFRCLTTGLFPTTRRSNSVESSLYFKRNRDWFGHVVEKHREDLLALVVKYPVHRPECKSLEVESLSQKIAWKQARSCLDVFATQVCLL